MAVVTAFLVFFAVFGLGFLARGRMRRDPAGANRRLMRGRWVSRPARRALGPAGALAARILLCLSILPAWLAWGLVAVLGGPSAALEHAWLALAAAESLWDVDDWLTGDDDDRRHRPLEWARVRLVAALRPLGYSTSTGGRA